MSGPDGNSGTSHLWRYVPANLKIKQLQMQ